MISKNNGKKYHGYKNIKTIKYIDLALYIYNTENVILEKVKTSQNYSKMVNKKKKINK